MSLLSRAAGAVARAARNSITGFTPYAPHQFGQPYAISATDDFSGVLITPARMYEIALKGPTLAACIQATIDYATGVSLNVRNKDAAKVADPDEVDYVDGFLCEPNEDNTGLHMLSALYRDIIVFGYGALEIVPDAENNPAALRNVDGVRLWIDYDEHGKLIGYNQMNAYGQPIKGPDGVHAWEPYELIYFKRNPQTKSPYPLSQLEMLFSCAVIETMMLAYIGGKFVDGNMPFGILDLGDITNDELKKAVASWNSQVESQHRIMLTNTRSGGKFIEFGYHLKDLEATNLLDKVRAMQMGILGVTMNELGESADVSKANGFYLSYTFKNRAIIPLLSEVCTGLTKWVGRPRKKRGLGLPHLEIAPSEIDSRDALLQSQIDDMELKHGTKSINQIRNRIGDTSIQGGDEVFLFANGNWIPVRMASKMAQAQLDAVLAEVNLLQVQAEQAKLAMAMGMAAPGGTSTVASEPMIRQSKMLETFTTPDGSGSSTTRLKLPRPNVGGGGQQKPRGPVQTLHNQGMRSDAGSP